MTRTLTRTLTRAASFARPDACRRAPDAIGPAAAPTVRLGGALGSVLRVDPAGLTVCHCADAVVDGAATCRTWPFRDLLAVRLARYGPLGVVEATLRATGTDLPLLILTPTQILPARRALPLIVDLLSHHEPRKTA